MRPVRSLPGPHPGRRSDGEITLFKNGGGSHLDPFTAEFRLRLLDQETGA